MSQSLNLVDMFWTFQGEGFHTGRRALFVRMPFCNLKCSWCDTEFNKYEKWTEEDFAAFASHETARFAVITGGEPMMNKHTPRVLTILKGLGFEIACESNGTFPLIPGFNFVTVSPKRDSDKKTPYYIHPSMLSLADEFKYVVDRYFDFSILKRHDLKDGRRYSLSPEFNEMEINLNKIFDFIAENPGWRISLQTHKWLNLP